MQKVCLNSSSCSSDICSESYKCVYHCDFLNHFHCIENDCNSEDIFCIENKNYCQTCCFSKSHAHCSLDRCDSTTLCEKNADNLCLRHCTYSDHSHCHKYCDNLVLCDDLVVPDFEHLRYATICIRCCVNKHKNHCSSFCNEIENICSNCFKCLRHHQNNKCDYERKQNN